MYVWACVTSSDTNTMERRCRQYSVANCQCDVSAFDFRRSMCQLSKIGVTTFEDWWSMCRPSKIDDQCVDVRISMCRLSKIDVSTFGDRWPMCRPSRIDVDVELCCYTCSKHWYYSCMRITLRVCTSVFSFIVDIKSTYYMHISANKYATVKTRQQLNLLRTNNDTLTIFNLMMMLTLSKAHKNF